MKSIDPIKIIKYLDGYLVRTNQSTIDPVEANLVLEKAGLLKNSENRPGKPLRDLLRKNLFPHAYQSGGKGTSWIIPHSNSTKSRNPSPNIKKEMTSSSDNLEEEAIIEKIEQARIKYKPDTIKYLLVAEAPPDNLNRFFYFEKVAKHDYLFLGVIKALYPNEKEKYLLSQRKPDVKQDILQQFKRDGFYLIDLSDLPISFSKKSLKDQLPNLKKKIQDLTNNETKIILIKANVFDLAHSFLIRQGIENVVNLRIPFPGQGGQKKFHEAFKKALKNVGYR